MKKIIFIAILILICIIVAGCVRQSAITNTNNVERYAMIIMPDGTLIQGRCEEFYRISSGWDIIKIDGITYSANEWRIVKWEK